MGEFLSVKTLGEAGRTGEPLPLQQCWLRGEGGPQLSASFFRCVSMGAGACLYKLAWGGRRGESLWPCAFVLGGSHQSFGRRGITNQKIPKAFTALLRPSKEH